MVEIVADSVATKELTVGKGRLLSSPSISANSLVLLGGTGGGLSILSIDEGRIYFGDAGDSSKGRLVYDHSNNNFKFYVGDTYSLYLTSSKTIDMSEAADNTPTIVCSGAIFISGGALWYKGFTGTYTKLAAS